MPARLVIQAGVEDLSAQLFPTAYYHVVFTVPHEFNALTMGNRKEMFNLLFEAASATLLQFSHDPKHLGATCGITTVLHTCLSRAKLTGGTESKLPPSPALHCKRWRGERWQMGKA